MKLFLLIGVGVMDNGHSARGCEEDWWEIDCSDDEKYTAPGVTKGMLRMVVVRRQ